MSNKKSIAEGCCTEWMEYRGYSCQLQVKAIIKVSAFKQLQENCLNVSLVLFFFSSITYAAHLSLCHYLEESHQFTAVVTLFNKLFLLFYTSPDMTSARRGVRIDS